MEIYQYIDNRHNGYKIADSDTDISNGTVVPFK